MRSRGDGRIGETSLQPRVWLLLGSRVGDNNQLVALARELGWPFETKRIDFNGLRRIPLLRTKLRIVASHSRHLISAPWPDLVLGAGYTSVPVARHIRDQSGGRTKLVHIGNPRGRLDDFNLQITTPQYPRPAAANLLELPFPIGNPARTAKPTPRELEWLSAFPRPRRLVAIGGPARHWKLDHAELARAVDLIRTKTPLGSLIAVTSARTDRQTRNFLRRMATGEHEAIVDDFPSFGTLLAESDEIYVTADSVSMLSEAVLSGKPVGMIPIERSAQGRLSHLLWELPLRRATLPDFRNFWAMLKHGNLVGTVELPVSSQACETSERAAEAVRSLFARGVVDEEQRS